MTRARCCWGFMLVLAITGCTVDDGGGGSSGGDDEPPPPPGPDAGPGWPPECTGDPCGLPNTPDCCDGTMCVDFGDYGDVHCAALTDEVEQCASGCVQETVGGDSICAPEEWCGVGGILPEVLCDVADTCDWWENQNTCIAYYESCVGSLSTGGQIAWIDQVNYCLSLGTCGDFTSCMYDHVEVCW